MKLLLDQNLSHRLTTALADEFPGSCHVRDHGLTRSDDLAIWDFAKDRGFVIVTKDADFRQHSFLRGHPPKVIWLRVGNFSTNDLLLTLQNRYDDILAFGADPESAILIVE